MTLSNREKTRARIIRRALLPEGLLGGLTDRHDAGAQLSEHVAGSPWHAALALRFALLFVWCSPLLVLRRPSLFGGLSPVAQVACLEALFKSRSYVTRQLAMLLKIGICLTVLGHEDVLLRLGAYRLDERVPSPSPSPPLSGPALSERAS